MSAPATALPWPARLQAGGLESAWPQCPAHKQPLWMPPCLQSSPFFSHISCLCSCLFCSGEADWMDQRAAERVVAAMAKHRDAKFPADLKVMITADAGHYPAIDQPGGSRLASGQARLETSSKGQPAQV